MGRAIVREPQAFLMDEPLSNLDAKLRVQMRTEVARIQRRLGTTMVYVTHDQTEAMTLGDRVAVMRAGIIQQVDSPATLYDDPINLFVAGFIGSPAMNFAAVTITDGNGKLTAKNSGLEIEVPIGSLWRVAGDKVSYVGEIGAVIAFLLSSDAGDEVEANGQTFLFRPRPSRPPIIVGGRVKYVPRTGPSALAPACRCRW